ncbi:MAG: NADH-quinone oxidoreductase subunit L, partial [Planctomycetes bacterium]|nr:NADH-quinone oxidoreductase subunit L [Planctomycetota bacterium]
MELDKILPLLLITAWLLPLVSFTAIVLFGRRMGKAGRGAGFVATGAIVAGFGLSLVALIAWLVKDPTAAGGPGFAVSDSLYALGTFGKLTISIGYYIDTLTIGMFMMVTLTASCIHVYSFGYMHEEEKEVTDPLVTLSDGSKLRRPGRFYRFYQYLSLFCFSMLGLVIAGNVAMVFVFWELVGICSYLLIGFYIERRSASNAANKAFIVNRVGDFGFVLGIAGVVYFTGSLDYLDAFAAGPQIASSTITLSAEWSVSAITLICICLFIGAMGKSAQVPLHVWLPDSMEGPTPISALIHAATMVTAGIYMVARLSPLFEQSEAAMSFVLVVGATTALFMGVLGVVNNDIKRVVAYSTLSQLGYMTVALGVSAYSVAIFHLMTHAFFKALLFLAAGSVIMGMHHEQDMRKMGALAKWMPITATTCWLGALALIGTPFFSGFYSKDFIIEAAHESQRWGATYAYICVLAGVFITALYTFRMIFMTFHGEARWGKGDTPHESPWV